MSHNVKQQPRKNIDVELWAFEIDLAMYKAKRDKRNNAATETTSVSLDNLNKNPDATLAHSENLNIGSSASIGCNYSDYSIQKHCSAATNNTLMDERDFTDHVMQVYGTLKQEREKWEKTIQVELITKIAKEAYAKVTEVPADINTALQEDVKKVVSPTPSNAGRLMKGYTLRIVPLWSLNLFYCTFGLQCF
ncbi:hypothetical protein D0Y65_047547 [Glycine soja]|nr:hypothetical protein D0Y65_047547 [Glycine soja]